MNFKIIFAFSYFILLPLIAMARTGEHCYIGSPEQMIILKNSSTMACPPGVMTEVWRNRTSDGIPPFSVNKSEKTIFFLEPKKAHSKTLNIDVMSTRLRGLDSKGQEIFNWDSFAQLSETLRYFLPEFIYYKDKDGSYSTLSIEKVEVITSSTEIPGNHIFKAGHLFVLFKNINTLAVIDPKSKKIVWAFTRHVGGPNFISSVHLVGPGRIIYILHDIGGDSGEGDGLIHILNPLNGQAKTVTWVGRKICSNEAPCDYLEELKDGNFNVGSFKTRSMMELDKNGTAKGLWRNGIKVAD
jgi:hypothetical protein